MSLLGSLLGGVLGQVFGGGQNNAANNPLMGIIGSLLQGGGAGAAGGAGGGLQNLINELTQGGLGREVNSWVSTGQNMPVSGDSLRKPFGQGRLQQMAQQSGLSMDELVGSLSTHLPNVVDRLTPEGRLPEPGSLDEMLKAFQQTQR